MTVDLNMKENALSLLQGTIHPQKPLPTL